MVFHFTRRYCHPAGPGRGTVHKHTRFTQSLSLRWDQVDDGEAVPRRRAGTHHHRRRLRPPIQAMRYIGVCGFGSGVINQRHGRTADASLGPLAVQPRPTPSSVGIVVVVICESALIHIPTRRIIAWSRKDDGPHYRWHQYVSWRATEKVSAHRQMVDTMRLSCLVQLREGHMVKHVRSSIK